MDLATIDIFGLDLLTVAILFFSGLFAGAINAVAGGGTFLTFGALTLVGLPPIVANATSSITQFPGYVTSTLAYWSDIKRIWRAAIALALASAVGSTAGAMILLSLDNPQFRALVPWLLLAATTLFALGPWLKPKPRPELEAARPTVNWKSPIVQFFAAIYGGFFGAGMGIMMLATLGLTERGDYHHLNALKNMLATVIALVAILVFVVGGAVAWLEAAFMAPGVAVGGYLGVWLAKRVPQPLVRGVVIVVGLALAIYYFTTA